MAQADCQAASPQGTTPSNRLTLIEAAQALLSNNGSQAVAKVHVSDRRWGWCRGGVVWAYERNQSLTEAGLPGHQPPTPRQSSPLFLSFQGSNIPTHAFNQPTRQPPKGKIRTCGGRCGQRAQWNPAQSVLGLRCASETRRANWEQKRNSVGRNVPSQRKRGSGNI